MYVVEDQWLVNGVQEHAVGTQPDRQPALNAPLTVGFTTPRLVRLSSSVAFGSRQSVYPAKLLLFSAAILVLNAFVQS